MENNQKYVNAMLKCVSGLYNTPEIFHVISTSNTKSIGTD
jgi:hypothetical protein